MATRKTTKKSTKKTGKAGKAKSPNASKSKKSTIDKAQKVTAPQKVQGKDPKSGKFLPVNNDNVDPAKMGRTQLAQFMSVAATTVDGWRKNGCPQNKHLPSPLDRTYNLEKVNDWLSERKRGDATQPKGNGTITVPDSKPSQAKASPMNLLNSFKAQREAIKLKIDQGKVVDRLDVDNMFEGRVVELKAGLVKVENTLPALIIEKLQELIPHDKQATSKEIIRRLMIDANDDMLLLFSQGYSFVAAEAAEVEEEEDAA